MNIPPDIIAQIEAKSLTGREAAKLLGISESWLSHLLTKQGFKRPPSPHVKHCKDRKALRSARTEYLLQLAADVKRRAKGIAQAAKEAGCSERTIYRMLDKLC